MKNKESKFKINKNVFLIIILLIVMVACAYSNIKYKNYDQSKILGEAEFVTNTINSEESIFDESRIEIEKARDTEITHLKALLESESTDEETKIAARNSFFEIAKSIEQEKICEEMIENKIKYDVMVIINLPQAVVTVDAEQLEEIDIIRIKEIILSQTALTSEAVKISLID